MASSAIVGPAFSRIAVAGATALVLLCSPMIIGAAAAKVGVTSATDGDPLGKPPTEAERVLRVGIDVQANEAISTKAGDRAHLVFLDGTSLTVGPDANLVIDKFVYDPQTKTGDLAITASKGVFRLVGGKISKTNAIVINTPSDTIGIRGGITIFNVESKKTISIFIFGFSMTINANGRIETVTRPGFEVTTNFGGSPGGAKQLTKGQLTALLGQFEGSKKGGTQGGGNADQTAKNSGFSDKNSSKGTGVDGSKGDKFGSGPGPGNHNPNYVAVTAITQALETAPSQRPTPIQKAAVDPTTTTNTMTSTVTFKGTMSGTAFHNGNASQANGTYQNVWNVGNRNGVASATFNGASFGGGSTPNTFAVGNSPVFVTPTPLPSTTGVPGRSLSLVGVTGQNSQAGGFVITGPRYVAGGTFQGTKQ